MKSISLKLVIPVILVMILCCSSKSTYKNTINNENKPEDSLLNTTKENKENDIVLFNCTLIDGTGSEPKDNAIIFIKNDMIEKVTVGKETDIPDNYTKIDLKGQFVLPGFINSHVHSFYSEGRLQNWLQNGVTTIRELAAPADTDFAVIREERNKNPLNARVVTATPFITKTGGYIPPFVCYINSPKEAVQKTKDLLKNDPDVIKISLEDDLQGQKWKLLSLEEVKSITKTAHEGNKKVAVHITHVHNLRLALDGGVDELSHMVVEPLTKELAEEIAQKGISWVPTLELWHGISEMYQLNYYKTAVQNLSVFYKAGGKIALGTDYGGYSCSFDGGMPITELHAMKEAGMTNMDIIVSATKNAAYVCGMEERIGTVENGKIADIIVTKDNPLKQLDSLTNLYMVIHNGKIVKQ